MTRKSPRTWPLVVGAAAVLAAFSAVLVAAAQPPAAPDPAGAPSAPGISRDASDLLQLDPLGRTAVKAPDYALTDQHGHRITPGDFHGRSVVLTFNDDECTDLCTLLAQDVVLADRDLGAEASKVAFVSVNANPYHPAVGDVASWSDAHGLGRSGNWYFGTAAPDALAATAKAYGVPIELDAANRTVVHGTEIFFIDPSGVERALGQFGTDSASTAPFAHTMAQEAVDLLPPAQRRTVGGSAAVDLSSSGAGVGTKPAPLTLPSLSGSGDVSTAASGRYTVLNFWASTCTACTGELAALAADAAEFRGRADVVGVDVSDDTTAARALAERTGTAYPVGVDADGRAAGRFRIPGLPFTVILDPSGRVVIRHPGAFTAEQLAYVLDSLAPRS